MVPNVSQSQLFRAILKGASVSAFALMAATAAHAQDTAGDDQTEDDSFQGLEEITVTARRVEENLQSTPVTVTAFTERALEVRGIVDTSELAAFTPSVTFDDTSTFSGASSTFQGFIRGIGQSDFAVNTDPGVGVYVDDVYIARTIGSVFQLYDIEQVEVLKGPQGTLFGRNSIGGAVNIRTARPKFDEFSFRGSAEYGRFDRLAFDAAINVPIAETVAATFAFSTQSQDGFQEQILFDPTGIVTPDNPDGIAAGPSPSSPFSPLIPIDQINTADLNGGSRGALNNQAIRGKILWEASSNFETTLSVDYSRIRDAAPAGTLVSLGSADDATFIDPATGEPQGLTPDGVLTTSLAGLFNACLGGPPAGAIPPCALTGALEGINNDGNPNNDVGFFSNALIPGNIDQTFATGANFSNIDSWGISSVSQWQLSDTLTLKSITAYRELSGAFGRDIDNSPFSFDQTSFVLDQNQFSQEVQLIGNFLDGRLNYTIGGFLFFEDALQIDQVPIGGGILNIFGPNEQDTRALSAFGEVDFEVADGLKIVFGARFTDERKRLQLNQQNTTPFFAGVFADPTTASGFIEDAEGDTPFPRTNADGTINTTFLGPEDEQEANFSDLSFRAGINYQISEDVFAFFTFSQGFKSGGFTTRLVAPFNPAFAGATATPAGGQLPGIVFDPETSDNFELGLKGDFLDNTLRLNAAAFWNNYDDIQIVLQAGISPLNANAGDARIRGIELEAEYYPVENLSFVGSFGYIDAEYRSISDLVAPQVTIDDDLQNTPEVTFAGAVNYVQPLGGNAGDLTFNLNYSWRSETANDAQNTPELIQGDVGQLGGQIKYSSADDSWALSVIGRNITDERIIGAGFNSGALSFVEASFNRGAEWRIRLDYNF